MQCDRAQEFFSDYVDRTLDRPMMVALESHFAACGRCREEVEGLRDLFVALEAVPLIEPPSGGAWRVIRAIQEEQGRRVETERRRAPGVLDWLRGLSPGSAAMGAGLATLVLGGMGFATGIFHVQNNPLAGGAVGPQTAALRTVTPAVSDAPSVQVSVGGLTSAGYLVRLRLVPGTDLEGPQVRVTNGAMTASWTVTGTLTRSSAMDFPVNLAVGSTAEALRMTVSAGDRTFTYLIVVPLTSQKDESVTLSLFDQPLDGALRELAPYLGRAVVVDGPGQGTIRLQLSEQSPRRCLDEIARQAGAIVRSENGVYRLPAGP